MKRVYRFRAWSIFAKKFVYGDLKQGKYNAWINDDFGHDFTVDPKTVGQLTGLKDANGDDIYEGDIVETFRKSRYECQYGLYSGIMLFKSIADARDSYFLAELHDPVVIGNIHENKELLNTNSK